MEERVNKNGTKEKFDPSMHHIGGTLISGKGLRNDSKICNGYSFLYMLFYCMFDKRLSNSVSIQSKRNTTQAK